MTAERPDHHSPTCAVTAQRAALTEGLRATVAGGARLRLRLAASLTNGSAEELAAALDVVKGVVAEYMPGGDQATEECTCGGSS